MSIRPTLLISFLFLSLKLIKEYCLGFIVKEENFYEIVMSSEFVNLDKPLMVEIIRKRLNPGKNIEIKYDKTGGKILNCCQGLSLHPFLICRHNLGERLGYFFENKWRGIL